jgi:tRNA-binding protein
MPQSTETGNILPTVEADQFFAVDIRSAVVTAAEEFPEARRPAYKLRLDLGPLGERVASAQITSYRPQELVGTTVVCVVNFPPRRIAGFRSEVLVLGVYDAPAPSSSCAPTAPSPPATGSAEAAGHRRGGPWWPRARLRPGRGRAPVNAGPTGHGARIP